MRCQLALAGTALAAAYLLVLRPAQLHWGTTPAEAAERLPGDELIGDPGLAATRAITIRTPPGSLWPWIAQLGQGRGGFYSYDALENLAGCEIHSADRLVPEWQGIEVGGEVRLAPQVALTIAAMSPGWWFVLRGGVPIRGTAPPYDFTWAFVIRERGGDSSRLLVRERYGYARPWARLLTEPVELASFVMTQKMLRGIRDRAEAHHPATAG